MSMSVCVSVCPRGYLQNHARSLLNFCASCLCPWLGPPSTYLRQAASPIAGKGFPLPQKFIIGRERGMGVHSAGEVCFIYHCLVCVVSVINCRCIPTDYLFVLSCEKYQHIRYVHSVHIHRVSKTSHLWLAITLMHMNGLDIFWQKCYR